MQAASGRLYRSEYFSHKAGYKLSFHKGTDFSREAAYFVRPDSLWNPKQTPLALLALLLLALPLLLTLQKLVELLAFGERSHQLFAVAKSNNAGLDPRLLLKR